MRARGLEAWPPELIAGVRTERRIGRDVLCYADRPAALAGLYAINRGGEKVYCVEVEEVLCAHPAVLEAAVVGLPDPVYGERVKACLVARPGARLEVEDVRGWARALQGTGGRGGPRRASAEPEWEGDEGAPEALRMIWRLTLGVLCLLFAAEEFVRTGPAAAEVVRHPAELVDALLAGDGSAGPWLLAAYGLLMMVRAFSVRRDG